MRFADPTWLWGLLLIPAFFLLGRWDEEKKAKRLERFAQKKLWGKLVPEYSASQKLKKFTYLLAGFAFSLLALARPQFGTHEEKSSASGMDVFFVLDVSNSMATEDVVPDRLQKAKHIFKALLGPLEGDRVGLVAFAGAAHVVSPLTTDLNYIEQMLDSASTKSVSLQGTHIGAAIEAVVKAFDRGAEQPLPQLGASDRTEDKNTSHAVILISDGEDHQAEALDWGKQIKERGIPFFILGIGTEKGGPVPLKDQQGSTIAYKRDPSGQTVISTFRPGFLNDLARTAGGKYWTVSEAESEVNDIVRDLQRLTRGEYAEKKFRVHEDRFQIPLFIALCFFLLELFTPSIKVASVIFLVIGMCHSNQAEASPLSGYIENEKGLRAFEKDQLEEAQRKFGSAQALDPSRPELEYNQGTVFLKSGEWDKAIQSFQKSAEEAKNQKLPKIHDDALYNLGHAYMQKKDYPAAVSSYLEALRSAKLNQNRDLESKARRNLELAIRQKQEQERKKEQDKKQDQKEKEGQEKDPQKGDGDPKDRNEQAKGSQANPNKPEQSPKKYEEPRSRKNQVFQSKKMTQEDADRVMSELMARERELQEKLSNQNVQNQKFSKDW